LPQNGEQISYVSQNGSGSPVNVSVSTFVPVLQREDGSYIGADGGANLIALGQDGSVVWQQQITTAPPNGAWPPAVYPLYATADGGAIVTTTPQCPPNLFFANACPTPQHGTLYTVDQNGNVTSQTPDTGAILSWTDRWIAASVGVAEATGTHENDYDTSQEWRGLRKNGFWKPRRRVFRA
jgi:hypothetical protein